jgi:hypothetical protein
MDMMSQPENMRLSEITEGKQCEPTTLISLLYMYYLPTMYLCKHYVPSNVYASIKLRIHLLYVLI